MEKPWSAPVREFMSRTIVAVRLDTPLSEVHHTLEQNEISAVPVVDDDGTLRGILSTKDLLRVARLEMPTPEGLLRVVPPNRTASDLMRAAVLTIDERATVGEAGAEMVRHRVHRLIVVREGRPCAVISTRDAMRAITMARIETPLAEVMTREVKAIDLGTPIDEAVAHLDDANVRGLVVVDGTWPIGVFTHTEALRAAALPTSMQSIPVERVMSYETVCLDVSTPIYRVANHARQMRVRRILAVEHRVLRGIATGFDLLRIMANKLGRHPVRNDID
jgi:predicted transcriptional regulator